MSELPSVNVVITASFIEREAHTCRIVLSDLIENVDERLEIQPQQTDMLLPIRRNEQLQRTTSFLVKNWRENIAVNNLVAEEQQIMVLGLFGAEIV